MKKLLLPFVMLIVFGMTSCMKQNENALTRSPANEELVKKYLDAIVKGDTSAIDGLLADNFMDYGPGINDSLDKAATIADIKKNWRDHWSSVEFDRYTMLSVTLTEERVKGDWVLDWATIKITLKDGSPPFEIQWHGVFRVENGKIVLANAFFDRSDIMRQMGFKFTPPDSTGK